MVSLSKNDVSIADIAWPLYVLIGGAAYALTASQTGPRATVVVTLVALWAVRLATRITWRHRGKPRDRRYEAICTRNEPHFRWKSLALVSFCRPRWRESSLGPCSLLS